MSGVLQRLSRLNPIAALALLIIFPALLMGGANSASGGALLALALLACLLGVAIAAPRALLARTLGANGVTLCAALAFIGFGLVSTLGVSGETAHPLWAAFDLPTRAASLSPYRTIEGAASFVAPCAAFLLGALAAPDSRARDQLGRWTMLLAAIYCILALGLFLSAQARPGGRLDPAISSANAAATVFGFLMIIAMVMIVRAARGRLTSAVGSETCSDAGRASSILGVARLVIAAPLSLATAMLAFAGLLLTASRGGLLAALIGAAVFALLMAPRALSSAQVRAGALLAPLIGLGALFAVLFMRGGDEVLRRFALTADDAEVRTMLAQAHWAAFTERPMLGHGLNAYHELNLLVQTEANWRALEGVGSAHNIFIQALEEGGYVGFGLLALIFAAPLVRAFATLFGRGGGAEWAAGAIAVSALALAHGSVDFGLQVPAVAALFAFLLGAGSARNSV